jgi:organic radical activating enzyme
MKSSQIEGESIFAGRITLYCRFSGWPTACLVWMFYIFHFFQDAIDSVMIHAKEGILPFINYFNCGNTVAN